MINTAGPLLNSYSSLLDGNLSYDSKNVPVFKIDAPETQKSHYVLLRQESESYAGNKRSFADNTVIIIDIVTIFQNNINSSIVDNIDNQIGALLLASPGVSGLDQQNDIEVLNVTRESTFYLSEDDGVNKYYRKIIRYTQRVLQTI